MRLSRTLAILICFCLLSCVKEPADSAGSAVSKKSYMRLAHKYIHPTEPLTLKLYANKQDYYNDHNVVQTLTFPPGVDSLEANLPPGVTYYYDVFSLDRTMTNWARWPYPGSYFTTTASPGAEYIIANEPNSIHRPLLLSNGDESSKWVAVGSFTKAGNTWDTMSVEGRKKSIIFRRDQAAIYTDGATTREFSFAVSGYKIAKNAFAIHFFDAEDIELVDYKYDQPYMMARGPVSPVYNALSPNSSSSSIVLPVTDTIHLTSEAFKHTFIMVREK